MKALEILKNLHIDVKKDVEIEGPEVFGYIETAIEESIKELEVIQDIMLEKDEALDVERLLFKNKLEEFRTMQKDFSRLKLLFDSEFCRCSKCGEYKRSGFGCYCENEY